MSIRVELRRDSKLRVTSGPWVRRRQISRIHGAPDPHGIARVEDKRGDVVGWGLVSPTSGITIRLLCFGATEPPADWLERRLRDAFAARTAFDFPGSGTTGYREVNSEGDGLPGLVIDRYGDDLVVQITTSPMAARQDAIVGWLRANVGGALHVVLPEHAAKYEGFEPSLSREHDRLMLRYSENGLVFEVPAPPSQKTGAYFDQRRNREVIARLAMARGLPMLDVGCHAGGFSLYAARRGVAAVGVDQSKRALALAEHNAAGNDIQNVAFVEADMFTPLSDSRLAGPFGTIVLDPPKMAARKSDVDRAFGALSRLVAVAAGRLAPHGYLAVCSCSHHLGRDHLDRVVAACDVPFARIETLGAGVDHPVAPGHREGEYLRVNVYQRREP